MVSLMPTLSRSKQSKSHFDQKSHAIVGRGTATRRNGFLSWPARAEGHRTQTSTSGRRGNDAGTDELPYSDLPVDLKREVDLIEEIARLYGVEKIAATAPRGASGSNPYDAVHDEIADARRILTGLGLLEAQGQTLISDAATKLLAIEDPVLLSNPLSSDMNVLRPRLLAGLIESLKHNLNHNNYDVALFEIGRVFGQRPIEEASGSRGSSGVREERHLAIALTGQRNPLFWSGEEREAKFDLYDLKGLLEEFFEQFGLRGMTYARRSESSTLFLESATIQLGKFQLGEFGQLLRLWPNATTCAMPCCWRN